MYPFFKKKYLFLFGKNMFKYSQFIKETQLTDTNNNNKIKFHELYETICKRKRKETAKPKYY